MEHLIKVIKISVPNNKFNLKKSKFFFFFFLFKLKPILASVCLYDRYADASRDRGLAFFYTHVSTGTAYFTS